MQMTRYLSRVVKDNGFFFSPAAQSNDDDDDDGSVDKIKPVQTARSAEPSSVYQLR